MARHRGDARAFASPAGRRIALRAAPALRARARAWASILARPALDGRARVGEATATTLLAVVLRRLAPRLRASWLQRASPHGAMLMLFLVGVTWIGETAAYLVGSTDRPPQARAGDEPAQDRRGGRRAGRRLDRWPRWCSRAWLVPGAGRAVDAVGGRGDPRRRRAGGRSRRVRDQAQRRHQGRGRAHSRPRRHARPDRRSALQHPGALLLRRLHARCRA